MGTGYAIYLLVRNSTLQAFQPAIPPALPVKCLLFAARPVSKHSWSFSPDRVSELFLFPTVPGPSKNRLRHAHKQQHVISDNLLNIFMSKILLVYWGQTCIFPCLNPDSVFLKVHQQHHRQRYNRTRCPFQRDPTMVDYTVFHLDVDGILCVLGNVTPYQHRRKTWVPLLQHIKIYRVAHNLFPGVSSLTWKRPSSDLENSPKQEAP